MSNVILLVLRRLRIPLIVLLLVYAIATFGMTLIPGVDDQGNVWHMGFFHAFYFVSFMGTTIGFGEVPYEFTDAQRFWVLICIYTSVISWLYAIGNMLSLIQDPTFKQAITNRSFERSIRYIDLPFYIICGYGQTGYLINKGLAEFGIQTIVIDINPECTSTIELDNLPIRTITLNADITDPSTLISAGIDHPLCKGVIAVTQNDHSNLQVAVSSKLLNKKIPVFCRSEIQDEAENMASFGTDMVINPYDLFAKQLYLLTRNPQLHRIQSWLVNQDEFKGLSNKPLPTGRWILCGYGRLGKAIMQHIQNQNIEIVIVDNEPQEHDAPEKTIVGRGTEAKTLIEAGIDKASVIIAGTDDDANNLSILMTAQQLNPQIYSIARVNKESNHPLFEQANCDYIMRRSEIVANRILTTITRPLVSHFNHYSSNFSSADTSKLLKQIKKLSRRSVPVTWRLVIDKHNAPAINQHLQSGKMLALAQISHNKLNNTSTCIPLLLKRDNICHLQPALDTQLKINDQILFCTGRNQTILAQRLYDNIELIDTMINQNPHHIPLLRWLSRR